MRLVIGMFIGLIVFLGIGIYSEVWLANTAKEVAVEVASLEEMILQKEWDEASLLIVDIQKKWKNIESKWDIIVDHREMDEVELALTRSKAYISVKNLDMSLAELAVLQAMVLHIAEKESLKLINVF